VKTHPLALLLFCFAAALPAQTPAPVVDASRTPEELDQMLAPIALYPDALVALILPAATAPTDIVLAARFLSANGPSANVDVQPWDESVRALAHYPDVVKWMDANPTRVTKDQLAVVYAWNEIGEGGWLVPCKDDPDGAYLKAIRRVVFGR